MDMQPGSIRLREHNYDTLEIIQVDNHLTLIQVSEDGESETLVIGPEQQAALIKVLKEALA